jgi:excinuclease ABC subunit C
MSMNPVLKRRIAELPDAPGVYLMKDASGEILYIGKAKSLLKRVRSHFSGRLQANFKKHVQTIDVLMTDSEGEALLLEHALVQKHRPRHNIRLKDDKRYPYIRLSWGEDFPRLSIVRNVRRDGASYFGPFPATRPARFTLRALGEIFPIRSCTYPSKKLKLERACIDYEMGRCLAPCIGAINREEYRELCQQVEDYLKGRRNDVRVAIRAKMKEFSRKESFERAAFYRDMLQSLDKVLEKQKMVEAVRNQDQDFLALSRFHDVACMVVIRRSGGSVSQGEQYFLEETTGASDKEVFEAFIREHYANRTRFPRQIVLPLLPEGVEVLQNWLGGLAAHGVVLHHPHRGSSRAMLELADKNALFYAQEQYRKLHGITGRIHPGLLRLAECLGLDDPPMRIEGYDISNIQGKQPVGSMVVFWGGRPQKSNYRKFKIRLKETPDDYAMMAEMLQRRFTHDDKAFAEPPHLVVIDGGPGQLSAARKVMKAVGADGFVTIGLAKQEELIFTTKSRVPIRLSLDDAGLKLLQQVRDEAHRFAITYHRSLRSRLVAASRLDAIAGVGKIRKQKLIRHFGSLEGIEKAKAVEIERVSGISKSLAQRIYSELKHNAKTGDKR